MSRGEWLGWTALALSAVISAGVGGYSVGHILQSDDGPAVLDQPDGVDRDAEALMIAPTQASRPARNVAIVYLPLIPELDDPVPPPAIASAAGPVPAVGALAPPTLPPRPKPAPPQTTGQTIDPASLALPTNSPEDGIVISVAERRLYRLYADGRVHAYPVAVGRHPSLIPLGTTEITRKRRNPTWVPTPSMRREKPSLPASVPPGPTNPMGLFAMDLTWENYRIHGTNDPSSIGRAASSGCFRMLPRDVEQLFATVSVGTPVLVIPQPVQRGPRQTRL